ADRLFVFGSEAASAPSFAAPAVLPEQAAKRALAWTLERHRSASLLGAPAHVGLRLVRARASMEVRSVYRVAVDARAPRARYDVYIDARTGEPVAREQTLPFAEEPVLFDVFQRGPGGPRESAPAPFLRVNVGGTAATTDGAGLVDWPGPDGLAL